MTSFLDEAIAIGDRIASAAIHHRDAANWIARRPATASTTAAGEPPSIRALQHDLYAGTAGIGVFLARLSAFSGEATHRDVARAALEHALLHARAQASGPRRLGFYDGALGVAWAAWEAGGLLGEPDLRRRARGLVATLATNLRAPHERDLMAGNAGAILALLPLEADGLEGAGVLAARLGDDLVRTGRKREGLWSWGTTWTRSQGFRDLLGLSHGTSGIALALATLHQTTGDERHREAARGALRYEHEHFDAAAGNWPQFSSPVGEGFASSVAWCHGAAGVGVARVLLHAILRDDALLKDAGIARETTRRFLASRLEYPGLEHTLCHGLLGTNECLMIVDEQLGLPPDEVQAVARLAIERYGREARERWGPTLAFPTSAAPGTLEPSLFLGEAGIGHHFLRLHAPARVPTLLVPGRLLRG